MNNLYVLVIIYYDKGIFFVPKITTEVLGLETSHQFSLAQVEECLKIWHFLPTSKRLLDELIDRCNKHATYIEERLARLRLVHNVRR